jgi:hypothetical protein
LPQRPSDGVGSRDLTRLAALWLWYGFIPAYAFLFVATLWGGLVFPLVLSVVLVPVAVVFAVIYVSRSPRTVIVVVAAALIEAAVGVLLLTDPSGTWHFAGADWRSTFRLPEPVVIALWLFGVAMPAGLAQWVLRQVKSGSSTSS